MDNMKDVILEAVEMNGIENVVMPLMNEIFLSFTDIAGTRYVDNQDVFKKLEKNDPLLLEREADNKYDSNAIKVLRWFPVSRQCALDECFFEEVNWGDVFYELGYISRHENAELHSFMLSNKSPLLFAKKLGDKISIIGGAKIFFSNDFSYPACLLKIPVK